MTRRPSAYAVVAAPTTLLSASGIRADWSDCQRQPVSPLACTDPVEWADRLFHHPPRWIAAALTMRDRAVARLGLRPTSADTFGVLAQDDHEVLLGSDDRHLDFRASVRCSEGAVDVTTFVQVHHRLGWLYLRAVRLVHASVVRGMLRRAASDLDPGPRSQE